MTTPASEEWQQCPGTVTWSNLEPPFLPFDFVIVRGLMAQSEIPPPLIRQVRWRKIWMSSKRLDELWFISSSSDTFFWSDSGWWRWLGQIKNSIVPQINVLSGGPNLVESYVTAWLLTLKWLWSCLKNLSILWSWVQMPAMTKFLSCMSCLYRTAWFAMAWKFNTFALK